MIAAQYSDFGLVGLVIGSLFLMIFILLKMIEKRILNKGVFISGQSNISDQSKIDRRAADISWKESISNALLTQSTTMKTLASNQSRQIEIMRDLHGITKDIHGTLDKVQENVIEIKTLQKGND